MSARPATARQAGLDVLRLAAILLVTVQHGLSVNGHYEQAEVGGLSYGQMGVAIFCAISGYLAFVRPETGTGRWFLGRLKSLFPAYWLAMLFSFALTWAFHAKDFSAYQFVSQMLGLGYFTHGWNLVNIVSWFLSLILLCYVLAAAARASGRPAAVLALVFAVAAWLVASRTEVDLSRHVLAFSVGGLLRLAPPLPAPAAVAALAVPWLLWPSLGIQFGYAALGGALLALALGSRPSPAWLSGGAGYIYEYFLLHGIFLVGLARFLPDRPLAAAALAVLATLPAAFILHHAARRLAHAVFPGGAPAS